MVEELKKAKHYIFLEYFIIQEGKMWNTILDILRQKAAEGVDVRVIYDDMGCIMILPTGYDKTLEQMGIKCRIFNPFVPILSSRFNTPATTARSASSTATSASPAASIWPTSISTPTKSTATGRTPPSCSRARRSLT